MTQADFLQKHLGPVMRRDHPDVKIMPFDHNRDHREFFFSPPQFLFFFSPILLQLSDLYIKYSRRAIRY